MKYKKLLLDIDGTVLSRKERLSEQLVQGVIASKDKISISFCTGRTPDFTLSLARKLLLRTNHIVDDGSRVIDRTGKELWAIILPKDVINYYINLARKNNFKIAATVENKLKLNISEADSHISRLFPYYLTKKQANILTSHVFSPEYEAKVVWFDEEKGYNVSITHIHGNKKHGIEFLLNYEKVKPDETIGIGDGMNDLPLFDSVGFKVAMEDAPRELINKADLVVPSVEQDGVLEVLKQFQHE